AGGRANVPKRERLQSRLLARTSLAQVPELSSASGPSEQLPPGRENTRAVQTRAAWVQLARRIDSRRPQQTLHSRGHGGRGRNPRTAPRINPRWRYTDALQVQR